MTGYPLLSLSASVGTVVAVLALLPPFVLIYLVSGKEGLKDGWPLAIVASFGYILGQYPVAVYLGPYLPDIAGAILSFIALLALLKVWRPATMLGFGGKPLERAAQTTGSGADPRLHRGCALRLQYLDERHVRQVPGAGGNAARTAPSLVAVAELGGCRDR